MGPAGSTRLELEWDIMGGRSAVMRAAAMQRTTGVKYPLLRACSSSAALRAAGLHTHVRTHRTSSDPAYLHNVRLLVHFREEEDSCYFRNPGPKKDFRVTASLKPRPRNPGLKGLSGNGFTRTVTPHLRSIVPNVQRHMAYFAIPAERVKKK